MYRLGFGDLWHVVVGACRMIAWLVPCAGLDPVLRSVG